MHRVSTTFHRTADTTNVVDATTAEDEPTSVTLANQIKTKYNAHRISTTFHNVADNVNAVTSDDATDVDDCKTLANEIKADYNAHRIRDILSQNITAIESFTDGNLYIGQSKDYAYYYKYDGFPDLLLNKDFEEWSDDTCTSWSKGTRGALAKEDTEVNGGSYSAKLTSSADGTVTLTQTLTWNADLKGYEVTFTAYVKASANTKVRLGITDKTAGTTNGSYNTGTGWEQLTVSRTIVSDATKLEVAFEIKSGAGVTVYCDDAAVTLDDYYLASTLSDGQADFFKTVDVTLWKACLPREMKSATDPTAAGEWTTEANISDTDHDITCIVEKTGSIYIMKEDMPYYMESGGAVKRLERELVH
ncbi:unnamed protein product [marine sediment metagenome]|uniref:CBM-cenC domain-containing protein n=1 Tax=marine sediment metagenome TaxID=412755 RepID=X1BAI3_9ZZZZ